MRLVPRLLAAAILAGLVIAPAAAQRIQPMPSQGPQGPSQGPSQGPGIQPQGPGAPSQGPGIQPQGPNAGPQQQTQEKWGAIAFTADGSYSTTWNQPTKSDAEAKVLRECAKFGRGACEVSALANHCIGLSSFRGGRWRLAFTAGGTSHPQAQQAAMSRCETDKRTSRSRNRCQLRISICGDGR